jgi:hypothetical protein
VFVFYLGFLTQPYPWFQSVLGVLALYRDPECTQILSQKHNLLELETLFQRVMFSLKNLAVLHECPLGLHKKVHHSDRMLYVKNSVTPLA